jgi:hypothetical protein
MLFFSTYSIKLDIVWLFKILIYALYFDKDGVL